MRTPLKRPVVAIAAVASIGSIASAQIISMVRYADIRADEYAYPSHFFHDYAVAFQGGGAPDVVEVERPLNAYVGHARADLTTTSSSISLTCTANAFSYRRNELYVEASFSAQVRAWVDFQIAAPTPYVFDLFARHGFNFGQIVFIPLPFGQQPIFVSDPYPPGPINDVSMTLTGVLPAGSYRVAVVTNSDIQVNPNALFSATLNFVPAPGSAAALLIYAAGMMPRPRRVRDL